MMDENLQPKQAATPQPAVRDRGTEDFLVVAPNSSTGTLPTDAKQNGISLETLGKTLAQLAIAAYAVGLLAVNSYLFGLGVSDFELFRARFVTTGFLIIGIITFAVAGPWYAWDSIQDMRAQDASLGDRLSGFSNFLIGLGFPWLLFSILLAIFNTDDPWFSGLGLYALSAITGYFIVLSILVIHKARNPQKGPSNRTLIVPESSGRMALDKRRGMLKQFFSGPTKNSRPISLSVLFGVSIFLLIYAMFFLGFFVSTVYPQIPEQFGGGKPREAILLISKDAVNTLAEHKLVPKPTNKEASQEATSIRLCILHQGSDYYVVRVIEDGRTFQLGKADIIGAYLDPRSSLAKKCIY